MKITRATFKSFIKKNASELLVSCRSSFDGMVDGYTSSSDKSFQPAKKSDIKFANDNTLGVNGVWLVGSSRDWFKEYSENGLTGIEVSNCCGNFIVAVRA